MLFALPFVLVVDFSLTCDLCTSYDGHILLNSYPFLDSKMEFTHDSLVCDVMKPQRGDPPLSTVDLSQCTIGWYQLTFTCTCIQLGLIVIIRILFRNITYEWQYTE